MSVFKIKMNSFLRLRKSIIKRIKIVSLVKKKAIESVKYLIKTMKIKQNYGQLIKIKM